MTSRIKIVGVQFAANPDHEPETPMTAQENHMLMQNVANEAILRQTPEEHMRALTW